MSGITLLYDHFLALGGAEKVSFALAEQLDDCVLETAWADEALFSEQLDNSVVHSFGHDFLNHVFPSLSLLWFYLVTYKTCASKVLATGVFSPLVLWRNKQIEHSVVYFHTFPSFIHETFTQLKAQHGLIGALVFKAFTVFYLRCLKSALKNANKVLVNSNSVKKRFADIGIDSQVLYPGVDLTGLENKGDGKFFLSTARLESNKRIDLVLAAFAQLPEHKLVVVGGGALAEDLEKQYAHCDNIELVGWQQEFAVKQYYNRCTALVYLPIDEYFGIAPVEANGAGKPVIGVAEGGLLETINDERLGSLIAGVVTVEQVKALVVKYAQVEADEKDILHRQQCAKRFEFAQFANVIAELMGRSS